MNKTLKTIEYDKVLEILSTFAVSDLGKLRCLTAYPLDDINTIQNALKLTTQAQNAYRMSAVGIPINQIPDITDITKSLQNKLTLAIEDIKDVFDIIISTRKFSSYLNKYATDQNELIAYTKRLFPIPELEEKIERIFDSNFMRANTSDTQHLHYRLYMIFFIFSLSFVIQK